MNYIPIFGWFISLLLSASISFPLWIMWSVFDYGHKMFHSLPHYLDQPNYIEIVAAVYIILIVKEVVGGTITTNTINQKVHDKFTEQKDNTDTDARTQ